ncbi:hypothetical protein HELRODRAFT_193694 [Helobdella robusta]|uniref:SWIM-type domain-containing protein n=1 Tax=Helobdella robusta TaxID=6412 RepID=T1FV97_HELRO|nr:hypothetical protein HELRODRAFT_193694 [Helobdella robusta]ESN94994.1 hypothetical protein HELRODRAFT_193694 [Helobdella robusta]
MADGTLRGHVNDMLIGSNTGSFECVWCHEKYHLQSILKFHLRKSCPVVEIKTKCPFLGCYRNVRDFPFHGEDEFFRHLDTHHDDYQNDIVIEVNADDTPKAVFRRCPLAGCKELCPSGFLLREHLYNSHTISYVTRTVLTPHIIFMLHAASSRIELNSIRTVNYISPRVWAVVDGGVEHYVTELCEVCPIDCRVPCQMSICQFLCQHMFRCTCPGYNTFCKHIHRVRQRQKSDAQKFAEPLFLFTGPPPGSAYSPLEGWLVGKVWG